MILGYPHFRKPSYQLLVLFPPKKIVPNPLKVSKTLIFFQQLSQLSLLRIVCWGSDVLHAGLRVATCCNPVSNHAVQESWHDSIIRAVFSFLKAQIGLESYKINNSRYAHVILCAANLRHPETAWDIYHRSSFYSMPSANNNNNNNNKTKKKNIHWDPLRRWTALAEGSANSKPWVGWWSFFHIAPTWGCITASKWAPPDSSVDL